MTVSFPALRAKTLSDPRDDLARRNCRSIRHEFDPSRCRKTWKRYFECLGADVVAVNREVGADRIQELSGNVPR